MRSLQDAPSTSKAAALACSALPTSAGGTNRNSAQYRRLEAEEQGDHDRQITPAGIDVAEHHDGEDAGEHEQAIMVLQFVGFMAAFRDPFGLSTMLAGTLAGLLATWVTFTHLPVAARRPLSTATLPCWRTNCSQFCVPCAGRIAISSPSISICRVNNLLDWGKGKAVNLAQALKRVLDAQAR
jgi:hypothetical protein